MELDKKNLRTLEGLLNSLITKVGEYADSILNGIAEDITGREAQTQPITLTYEDLACEQGLELLTYLFGGYWQYDAIGLFREWGERGEYQDYINFEEPCDDELKSDFGFVSLILAAALPGRDSYQVGYDWKLPNGEGVKAVFVPKTQVKD